MQGRLRGHRRVTTQDAVVGVGRGYASIAAVGERVDVVKRTATCDTLMDNAIDTADVVRYAVRAACVAPLCPRVTQPR